MLLSQYNLIIHKHQGKTKDPEGPKLRSDQLLASVSNDGATQIKRYIRLTNLIPELIKLVDNTVKYDKRTHLTMGIKPAVELSYLTKEEQQLVYETIKYNDATPSHAQTIKIRELSKIILQQVLFPSLDVFFYRI